MNKDKLECEIGVLEEDMEKVCVVWDKEFCKGGKFGKLEEMVKIYFYEFVRLLMVFDFKKVFMEEEWDCFKKV